MERSTYFQLAEIEDNHWWFVYRRKLMALLIERLGGIPDEAALDIGCGTGGNMSFLKNYCVTVTGIDLSDDALALARNKHPGENFVKGDINKLRDLFAPASFSLISDFTVLYHSRIKSDLQTMRDIHHLLRPGGAFVLSETAFPILCRAHDRIDYGARRYRLGQLRRMLAEAGFCEVQGTYFVMPAFPVALVLALVERLGLSAKSPGTGVAELAPPPNWLNNVALGVLGAELAAIRAFGAVPFGVSVACVARKPVA